MTQADATILTLRASVMTALQANAHLLLRRNYVYANGPRCPDLMLVGDAPTDVDEKGNLAFSGDAGDFVRQLMPKGFTSTFTHVLKLRPAKSQLQLQPAEPQPDNRKPKSEEVQFFAPFLLEELEFYQPKVVVAMGNTAGAVLTGDAEFRVADYRGDIRTLHGRPTVFTYHPSFLHYRGQRFKEGKERSEFVLDLQMASRLASR